MVIIDPTVSDYQSLAAGVKPGTFVHILDPNRDGITQITEILTGLPAEEQLSPLPPRSPAPLLSSLHIISHGSPGSLKLGNTTLNAENLAAYQDQLQQWQTALTPKADILIYGCNVAEGVTGQAFVQQLAHLTKANIAASTNKTGNPDLGGDWNLEFAIGLIKSSLAFTPEVMQSYSGILNNAPDVGFVNLLPGNTINNGLGGAQGFGENQIPGDDDGFDTVDVSAVFQDGFRYFSNTWDAASEFFIGYNGYVTFGQGSGGFSPSGIAGSTIPMVAAHYTDVHTGKTPIAYNPAGNSTGTNKIYYDIDPVTDVVTVTFDDVVDFDGAATTANAYQIRLWDLGGGDFGIELRYEDLAWGSNWGQYGTAGWTAGDQTNYSELPGSGTSAIENIESESNIGQPGVFFWQVKDGLVFPGLPLQPPGLVAIDVNETDPPGVSVSDQAFTDVLSDLDGDPLGIAVVAVDNTNGTWQYSTDGGTNWTDFGSPSDSNARLLAGTANNQIRFVPNPNYEGNAGNLLFRAWDQTSGTDGGVADTSTNGGATAFSSRTLPATLNVVAINDQPSFSNAGNQTLAAWTNTAQTVANWANTFVFGPADEQSSQAVQDFIVNVTSGSTLFTTPPDIANDGTLTYTPNGTPGTATISVQLQDDGGTANGGVDTSAAATFTITITIPPSPVNLSVDSATGTEAGTTAITVTATAPGAVFGDQTVDLALTGDATAADFTGTVPTQITIANGTSSGQVTFTIADDKLDEINETANLTISNPSAGILLGTTTGSFTITDDDTAAVTVTPTSGLTTTEAGGTATFDVVLDTQPIADVTITVASSNTAEGTVDKSTLTFTAANWNTAQTVTVRGVDDSVQDGDIGYTISTTANSTDTNYSGLTGTNVSVTNTDNDTAGITVSPTTGTTTEAGGTATFDVVLDSQPIADVTITVASSNTAEGTVDKSTLTFTAANWNTAQTVTVTGVDDNIDDGDIGYTISTTANSTDTNYSGLMGTNVSVTNTDNDEPVDQPVDSGLFPVNPLPPFAGLSNLLPSDGTDESSTTSGASKPGLPEPPPMPPEPTIDVVNISFTTVGTDSAENIDATPNDDVISGQGGNDIIRGLEGRDALFGNDGDDEIYGNQGADLLNGNQGKDIIYAGQGNDLAYGGQDDDFIYGDLGSDTLIGDLGDDTLFGGTSNPDLVPGDGADVLYGKDGNDFLHGHVGNDSISGGTGNDTARGGQGDDLIHGDEGDDIIYGDKGNDSLAGGTGNDAVYGGEGNDFLWGQDGDDFLYGDAGDDTLIGNAGKDYFVLQSGFGSDTILDFTDGIDLIGLAGGLTFDQLSITGSNGNTLIASGNELLATLTGVDVGLINSADFTLMV